MIYNNHFNELLFNSFSFFIQKTSILVIMLSIIKQTNSFFNKPFGFPHNFMYVCNRNQIQHLHL